MADTNMNGVDDAVENAQQVAEYKARAVSAKFKQQVSYGVGAAMVFGLVGAVATKLFAFAFPAATQAGGLAVVGTEAAVAAFSLPAILGLVALGVAGVGLLYLSANYLSENTVLDQTMQAKQISYASRSKVPAVEQVVEPKVSNFPSAAGVVADAAPAATANDNDTVPKTSITAERSLADTIVARGAANENTPTDKANASWEEKLATGDEPQTAKARG